MQKAGAESFFGNSFAWLKNGVKIEKEDRSKNFVFNFGRFNAAFSKRHACLKTLGFA
jgi:hypothetical protein